jgi:phosphoadenosine phosphosulfate reductase
LFVAIFLNGVGDGRISFYLNQNKTCLRGLIMSELFPPESGGALFFSGSRPTSAGSDTHPPRTHFADIADHLVAVLPPLDLFQRLALIRATIPGRLVFTTSFGLEDQAIGHAIFSQRLAIHVVTLDTGRLFPETHDVWAETEHRYGVHVRAFVPTQKKIEALVGRQGIDGFRSSVEARHACCDVRKVMPLGRALARASGWITGLRAEQSGDRARLTMAALDQGRHLVKVSPLLDWRREQVVEFVRTHDVPYNRLHDRGFLSVGCAPCTRAVRPGEPERAGRWWWEQETPKECGLHFIADGRVVRARTPPKSPA